VSDILEENPETIAAADVALPKFFAQKVFIFLTVQDVLDLD
jgi:hypothetical protein